MTANKEWSDRGVRRGKQGLPRFFSGGAAGTINPNRSGAKVISRRSTKIGGGRRLFATRKLMAARAHT